MFSRKYGIEIEAISTRYIPNVREEVARIISAAGVPCVAAYAALPNQWRATHDGSLIGGTGVEVKSPPLMGEEGLAQLSKVCQAMLGMGLTINRTCGLHVHVDIRGLDNAALARLAIDYARHEQIIDSVLPRSRRGRGNRYCRSIASADLRAIASATNVNNISALVSGRNDRYVKLNFRSFWRHGTVEFRHHSGTVEGEKAANWVKLCLRMVDKAIKGEGGVFYTEPAKRKRRARQNSKTAIVVGLLMRPEGTTRVEILAATGWPSVSVQQVAKMAGIVLRTRSMGSRKLRYYGEQPRTGAFGGAQLAQAPTIPTLDSFVDSLGMPDLEKAYWKARRDHFAQRENRNLTA